MQSASGAMTPTGRANLLQALPNMKDWLQWRDGSLVALKQGRPSILFRRRAGVTSLHFPQPFSHCHSNFFNMASGAGAGPSPYTTELIRRQLMGEKERGQGGQRGECKGPGGQQAVFAAGASGRR